MIVLLVIQVSCRGRVVTIGTHLTKSATVKLRGTSHASSRIKIFSIEAARAERACASSGTVYRSAASHPTSSSQLTRALGCDLWLVALECVASLHAAPQLASRGRDVRTRHPPLKGPCSCDAGGTSSRAPSWVPFEAGEVHRSAHAGPG